MFRLIVAICALCGFSLGVPFVPMTIAVGQSGIWSGILTLTFICLLTIAFGLLYLEAFLAVLDAQHIVSLSKRLTGRVSSYLVSFFYLLNNYGLLLISFIFMYSVLGEFFSETYLIHLIVLAAVIISGILISLGRQTALTAIALLFLMFLGFFGYSLTTLFPFAVPQTKSVLYFFYNVFLLGAAYHFFFYQIFYQSLLPTVINFLNRDRKKLVSAIWIGLGLALIIQIIWIWVTLRNDIYKDFLAVFESSAFRTQNFNFLGFFPQFRLAFFAMAIIITVQDSLCLGISLKDFFEDMRLRLKNFLIVALILIPPWVAYLTLGTKFETARSVLGVIAAFVLAFFVPLIWVWTLRYHDHYPIKPVLFGGKKMLIALTFIVCFLFFAIWIHPQDIYW